MDTGTECEESKRNEVSPTTKIYFLKPKIRGNRVVYNLPKDSIAPNPWRITGFWIKSPENPLIARFYAGDQLLSTVEIEEVSVALSGKRFTKIEFFPEPFPFFQIRFQSCQVEITGSYKAIPMFFTYEEIDDKWPHNSIMALPDGTTIEFEEGRARIPKRPESVAPKITPKSYADILEEIGQHTLAFVNLENSKNSDDDEISIKGISPIDAHNYVKAVTDLGFNHYRLFCNSYINLAHLTIHLE